MANDWRGIQILVGQTVIVSPKSENSSVTECIVEEVREKNLRLKIIRRAGGVSFNDKEYIFVLHSNVSVVHSLPSCSTPTYKEEVVAKARFMINHYQTTSSTHITPEHIARLIAEAQRIVDRNTP